MVEPLSDGPAASAHDDGHTTPTGTKTAAVHTLPSRTRRAADSPLPLDQWAWAVLKAAHPSHPQRSFRKPRCDGPLPPRPGTTPVGRSDFPQVAHMQWPQTADLRLVCTGTHAADPISAASSNGMANDDATKNDEWPMTSVTSASLCRIRFRAEAVSILEFTCDRARRGERSASRSATTPRTGHPNALQKPPMQGSRVAAANRPGLEFLSV